MCDSAATACLILPVYKLYSAPTKSYIISLNFSDGSSITCRHAKINIDVQNVLKNVTNMPAEFAGSSGPLTYKN